MSSVAGDPKTRFHTFSSSPPATTGSLEHTVVFKLLYFRNPELWIRPPTAGLQETAQP